MEHCKIFLILIVSMFCGISAKAQGTIFSRTAPTGQTLWYYQNDEAIDSVWVIAPNAYDWGSYTKPSGNLVIPDNVERYGTTYYVRGIFPYAFIECAGLRSVVVSDGIPMVSTDAFKDCTGMTDITLGKQTQIINTGAFKNCCGLEWMKFRADFVLALNDSTTFEGVPSDIPIYIPCNKSMIYSVMLDHFTNFVETVTHTINATADYDWHGEVNVVGIPTCDSAFVELHAIPADGYHFVEWNDGSTENPRVVELTSDTDFVATFAYGDLYTITVLADDPTMGSVTGGGVYEAFSSVTITATPYSGYRFVRWSDGNTRPERTMYALRDTTFIAYFESTNGIFDADKIAVNVLAENGSVVISGAIGRQVNIYDMMGRQIVSAKMSDDDVRYQMPTSGVFLVRIEDKPAIKIVVR